MKNIHILPTDKPSRLYLGNNGNFVFGMMQTSIQSRNDDFTNQNIYITSDEEIKVGDWFIPIDLIGYEETSDYDVPLQANIIQLPINIHFKKIILTTDQDLIIDGVQSIDDEFLEWFVKNPSCDFAHVLKNPFHEPTIYRYKIIIPQEQMNPTPTENPPIKNGDVYDMGQTVNGVSRFLFFNEKWYYFEERLSRECRKDKSELTKLVNDTENDFNEVKYIGNIFSLNLSENK